MTNRPPSLRAPNRLRLFVGVAVVVVVVVLLLLLLARAAHGQAATAAPATVPPSAGAPCVEVAQTVTVGGAPGRDPCPCAGVGLLPRAWRELFGKGPQK
jgi:hypothetical protein